jgi:L-methionine (R)-S-oxide reductase
MSTVLGKNARIDLMDEQQKRELYREVSLALRSVLEGLGDPIAAMASGACLLHAKIPYSSWTGFYRVVAPGLMRVGPYQGPLGCLEIPFDRGVCGAAARERKTQVVADVNAFPGHIACDSGARSEIVVPVFDPDGRLTAVLDLDSHSLAAFDETDREELERIAEILRPSMREDLRPLGPERAH